MRHFSKTRISKFAMHIRGLRLESRPPLLVNGASLLGACLWLLPLLLLLFPCAGGFRHGETKGGANLAQKKRAGADLNGER